MTDSSFPSICIPKTFTHVSWGTIKYYFERVLGEECVKRVDLVPKTNRAGDMYQCVFIHMNKWPDNEMSREIRLRLIEKKEVKIVYCEPWFWRCYASKQRVHKHKYLVK